MSKQSKPYKFIAPPNVVDEDKQCAVTDLLNAKWYVLFTDDGYDICYKAQCLELLLEGCRFVAEHDKDFKEKLTDLVIDLNTERTNGTY